MCVRADSLLLGLMLIVTPLAASAQAPVPAAGQAGAPAAATGPGVGLGLGPATPPAALPAQSGTLFVLSENKEGALEIGDGGLLKVGGNGYVLSQNGRSVIVNRGMVIAQAFGLGGGASVSDPERVMVQQRLNVAGVNDPLANLPEPDPQGMQEFGPLEYGPNRKPPTTLSPGVYESIKIGFNTRVAMRPGIYIINRGLDIGLGSTLSGQNAMIYIRGKVTIGTGGLLSLTAPTDGPYKGVTWFSVRGNTEGAWILDRGVISDGAIYLPDGTIDIWGGGKVTAPTVIAGVVKVAGTMLVK